ncbi:hypothetical protein N9Q58_04320 [Polaribacter sp.]|nr:hypothetical protein [Polaribacter sp.]
MRKAILIFLIIVSCQKKEFTYSEFSNMKATHTLDSRILSALDEIINKENAFVDEHSGEKIIAINVKVLDNKNYDFCFTKTNFNSFVKQTPSTFEKYIGFTKFEGIPVILFANKKNKLFFKRGTNNYDFFNKNDYEGTPFIYHPLIVCKDIGNGTDW